VKRQRPSGGAPGRPASSRAWVCITVTRMRPWIARRPGEAMSRASPGAHPTRSPASRSRPSATSTSTTRARTSAGSSGTAPASSATVRGSSHASRRPLSRAAPSAAMAQADVARAITARATSSAPLVVVAADEIAGGPKTPFAFWTTAPGTPMRVGQWETTAPGPPTPTAVQRPGRRCCRRARTRPRPPARRSPGDR